MNIIEKLKELGYSTVPEEFYTGARVEVLV